VHVLVFINYHIFIYSPAHAVVSFRKTILKFTLKQLQHVSTN